MMNKKFHINWYYVVLALGFVIALVGFIYFGLASADPAGYNWKLEYLRPDEAVDAYLHEGDVILSMVFYVFSAAFFILMFLDLFFRKKSSHILAVEIGTLIVLAYEIAFASYAFVQGSVNIVTGLIYLMAAIGTVGTMILYAKKAFDGDHLGAYWVFFLVSSVMFFFGCAGDNSYSILNAYSHNGDFSYWFGFGASRLVFIILLLTGFVNLFHDYCPEIKEVEVQE